MSAEIEAIVTAEVDPQGPGAVVAVVKDGSLLYCKGHGLANLEWDESIAFDTVFRLASITKQFTATAILLLQAQGKLSIDDPITMYLPGYPAHGSDITITHLLTHTSGIKSYTSLEEFLEKWSKLDLSHDELIATFKDHPLEFEPGSQFKYNNSGYHLLGRIIETVSGMNYEAFVQTQIFQPLGMTHSYYMSNESIIPHRASGYIKSQKGYQHAPYINMMIPYSAGSLGSTIEDLIRWDAALRGERLLDRATQEHMYKRVQLTNGQSEDYGLGWGISDYRDHRVVHHGGGIHGFSTFIARFLDDAATVIVLSNLADFDAEKLTRHISTFVLDMPVVTRNPIALDEDAMNKVIGKYDTGEFPIEVVYEGSHLTVRLPEACHLLPISESTFYAAEDEEFEVRFEGKWEQGFHCLTLGTPFFSLTANRITDESG